MPRDFLKLINDVTVEFPPSAIAKVASVTRFFSVLSSVRASPKVPHYRLSQISRPLGGKKATMPKPGFYAVQVGRIPGVYTKWDECEAQIRGFPSAKHKKFLSLPDAEKFVAGVALVTETIVDAEPPQQLASQSRGQKREHAEVENEPSWDIVYCDGACKGNGQVGSVAGIGVWWGDNDQRNIAERCPGEQTNNRAELIAIVRVLQTTKNVDRLCIRTDSKYSIKCLTEWLTNWRSHRWKTSQNQNVKNRGIIEYIDHLLQIRKLKGMQVKFEHVKGHSGDVGNDGADYMANLGTTMSPVDEPEWKNLLKPKKEIAALDAHQSSTDPNIKEEATEMVTTERVSCKVQKRDSGDVKSRSIHQDSLTSKNDKTYQPGVAIFALPPLVPVRKEDINFEDYADCLLSPEELAKEMEEC